MLPRAHRIRRRSDIETIARRGVAFYGKLLTLRVARPQTAHFRCVCSVSQRVSKRATERNRLRRQLQEIVRSLPPSLVRPADTLLVVRPQTHKAPFGTLSGEVHALFHRAHLLP